MNIHERPLAELVGYDQARLHIVDTVLASLPNEVLSHSLLSGFDAKDALEGNNYVPMSAQINKGTLYAASIDSPYLSWVGYYAIEGVFDGDPKPAVGVYEAKMFDAFSSVGFYIKSGLTIVDACTDIFVWR